MGKTVYILCTINMAASAVALWLLLRPSPAVNAVRLQPEWNAPASAGPPHDDAWLRFQQATTGQEASAALSLLASNPVLDARVSNYIRVNLTSPQNPRDHDQARLSRLAAALALWGNRLLPPDPDLDLLASVAENPDVAILLRENALRAWVNAAVRNHARTGPGHDPAWREQVARFLVQTDFGTETSIPGLALQAAVFVQKEGIAPVDRTALLARLRSLLAADQSVEETTVVACLEVAAQLQAGELIEEIRHFSRQPRSDAIRQAAILALGQTGDATDLSWLDHCVPKSPATFHALVAARVALTSRRPNP